MARGGFALACGLGLTELGVCFCILSSHMAAICDKLTTLKKGYHEVALFINLFRHYKNFHRIHSLPCENAHSTNVHIDNRNEGDS